MRKPIFIVVDTNIIFSALLNTNSKIGEILLTSDGVFTFYSCSYMRFEIEKHWNKLKKISKLSEDELQVSKFYVFSKLNFINEELIPAKVWKLSEEIVGDIDKDDIDFIALNSFIKGHLWTGDKELLKGLLKVNYKKVLSTKDIQLLREK